jgi:8-oxo-dGTP diphosphatase
MLQYTISFIRQDDRFLLLNREYPVWMGMWNAPGGKLEPGETPGESALREIAEETGLSLEAVEFKGIVTWFTGGREFSGMYVYHAELPPDKRLDAPIRTTEGILIWKRTDWILHDENMGITPNVAQCVRLLNAGAGCFEYRCHYEGDRLIRAEVLDLDRNFEHLTDPRRIEELLLNR